MKKVITILATALLAGIAYAGATDSGATTMTGEDASVVAKQLPSYPLTTCPISGDALDSMGDPIDMVHDGRLVRFCCKGCVKGFKKDPAASIKKIDAAVVAAQVASYPMEKCVVSGEALTAMGAPLDHVHGTRLVRLCCGNCVKSFKKDTASFMAKVDAALIAAQIKTYPTTECFVSAEPLTEMGEPIDVLYGTRLVRFCCKGCVKQFKKDPKAVLAKLDAAQAKKG